MESHASIPTAHKPKRNIKKIIFVTISIMLLLVIITAFIVNIYINRSIAQTEGTIELPILDKPVTIITDEHGIPHINAENAHDLYISQGYIKAQSRMFQMEMARRQASGTLSEVAGEDALNRDKYFRTLGLRRAAEKSYDLYSEEAKDVLHWFSDGVNAYLKQAKDEHRLPIEFTLMGITPEKWKPLDSLTIGKYMAFDLGGHWEQQAFNYYALQNFDEDKALELFPNYPINKPSIIENDEFDIVSSFDGAIIPNPFNGSNNWVVSGDKTKSGLPLLADDPHLGLTTPSIWYQMHLETPKFNVSGVIFAGVPGIILGHNEHIAWGVTNTGPDAQQLYIEKRNPNHPHEFLYEEKWEKANVISEPIKVKDGKTIDYKVIETRHGPIITDFSKGTLSDQPMSLRWTALDPTTELEAILEINQATDWKSFEKGLEKFLAPAQNFVFASTDGTIAYKANGNIPIYKKPDDALLPLEGWRKENNWKGYIPFDELPTVINPEKGFIATANNKVIGDDYPYHISNVWAQPYRYERIAEVLDGKENLTVKDMQQLQMDQNNLQAREFVPLFLETLKNTNLSTKEQQALKLLSEWDFIDKKKKPEPLIFHHWMSEMENVLYEDEISEKAMKLFGSHKQTTDELLRKGNKSIWIMENGGLEKVIHIALENTIKKLEQEYGDEMGEWQWGDYHRVQFPHPLAAVNPILEYFFNREDPISVGGSSVTPMAAAYPNETGIVDHGASWRFVIDMKNPVKGYHIVGPGQAGHFKSKWYHDQLDNWVNGTFHETYLNEENGDKLELTP